MSYNDDDEEQQAGLLRRAAQDQSALDREEESLADDNDQFKIKSPRRLELQDINGSGVSTEDSTTEILADAPRFKSEGYLEKLVHPVLAKARMLSPRWILVWLCIYTVLQAMIASGLFPANETTLEKRYEFTSSQVGLLGSIYDILIVATVLLCAHYGKHKARVLGLGLFVMGFGCLLFALPQWITGGHYAEEIGSGHAVKTQLCYGNGTGPGAPVSQDCADNSAQSNNEVYGILVVAQLLIGLGAVPLYVLGPVYIDENVELHSVALYLGVFFSMAAIGPALGFILGGSFLTSWVDPGQQPAGLTPTHPDWVGAWWTGYVLVGVMSIFFALPLYLYPRYLPNTEHIRAEKLKSGEVTGHSVSKEDTSLRHLALSMKSLAMNKTFIFNCLGASMEVMTVSALTLFISKYVEVVFAIPASTAAITVGVVVVPGAAGGILFGGWLMKRLKSTGRINALACFISSVASISLASIFFIGCSTPHYRGISFPYDGMPAPLSVPDHGYSTFNVTSPCNGQCACQQYPFQPVCGDDHTIYFSPCYAGCSARTTNGSLAQTMFTNCSCIDTVTQTATWGRCGTDCKLLGVFLFALFVIMFCTLSENVPATNVVLRCLPPSQRALGLAIQSLMYRAIGAIPGPVLFGTILDGSCLLWETKCGERGSCWIYDNFRFQLRFVLWAVVCKGFSALFFFFSFYFYKSAPEPPKDDKEVITASSILGADMSDEL